MNPILALREPLACSIHERMTRFTVKIYVQGTETLALLRNTGRLRDLIHAKARGLCVRRAGMGKTGYLLAGVRVGKGLYALIDPVVQMEAFQRCVHSDLIPWMRGWRLARKEVPIAGSRLDYELRSKSGATGFLEVKSAVYYTGYYTMYPDCPSFRGQRHVHLLRELKRRGHRSIIAFMAAHPLARAFRPSLRDDPRFAQELKRAWDEGVEVYAVKLALDGRGRVYLADPQLAVHLS